MNFLANNDLIWMMLAIVPMVLIIGLVIVAIIVRIVKFSKAKKALKEETAPLAAEQIAEITAAFGGADNIQAVERQLSRVNVTVVDVNRADAEAIKALGAQGVLLTGTTLKCNFKEQAEYIYRALTEPALPVEGEAESEEAADEDGQ